MNKKKIIKLLLGNGGFVLTFIILFSPGFLGLRPMDESIFRAALAVTLGIMTPVGMVVFNYKTLTQKEEHRFIGTDQYTIDSIQIEMKQYLGSIN